MSDDAAIEAFWADAKVRAKVNKAPGYLGVTSAESLCPPAWSFGATPEEADELLGLVLAGTKTATASALRDYEGQEGHEEPLPAEGDLSIITNGRGEPRALIQTTRVRTAPFQDVDAEHAAAEGEGDLSLEHWRTVHHAFFEGTGGRPFAEDEDVVLEEFRVLYGANSVGD